MVSNITKILAIGLIGCAIQAISTGIMLQTQHVITTTHQIIIAVLSFVIAGICFFISKKTQKETLNEIGDHTTNM